LDIIARAACDQNIEGTSFCQLIISSRIFVFWDEFTDWIFPPLLSPPSYGLYSGSLDFESSGRELIRLKSGPNGKMRISIVIFLKKCYEK
jgi:hypothetical protein